MVEDIASMGDEIEANRTAKDASLPTVPGHWAPIPDADTAVRIATSSGLPVMLKATAGDRRFARCYFL